MIIGSYEKLAIGEIKRGVYGPDGRWYPDQPFQVIRIATRKEWQEGLLPERRHLTHNTMEIDKLEREGNAFFYEVSVD